jgi:hypothetical protein
MPSGTFQRATAFASTSAAYTLARDAFTWRLTRVDLTSASSQDASCSRLARG